MKKKQVSIFACVVLAAFAALAGRTQPLASPRADLQSDLNGFWDVRFETGPVK